MTHLCSVQTKEELFCSHKDKLIHLACKYVVGNHHNMSGKRWSIFHIWIWAGKDKKDYACWMHIGLKHLSSVMRQLEYIYILFTTQNSHLKCNTNGVCLIKKPCCICCLDHTDAVCHRGVYRAFQRKTSVLICYLLCSILQVCTASLCLSVFHSVYW